MRPLNPPIAKDDRSQVWRGATSINEQVHGRLEGFNPRAQFADPQAKDLQLPFKRGLQLLVYNSIPSRLLVEQRPRRVRRTQQRTHT